MEILVITELFHQTDQIVTEIIPLEMQLIAFRHFSENDKIFTVVYKRHWFVLHKAYSGDHITSYELYLLGVQEVADVSVLKHVLRPLHQVQGVVPPELGLVPDLHTGHILLDADEDGGVGERPRGERRHL